MRALVIGGSGFLGKELCSSLKDSGFEVRSYQRNYSKKLEDLNVNQILGSVEQFNVLTDAMKGCDAVLFCGGKVDIKGSHEEHFKINYVGVQNAIKASLKHKIKAFVLTSTPSVFLNSKGIHGLAEENLSYSSLNIPYVQSKIAAEKQLLTIHRESLSYVILRPHQIWCEETNPISQKLLNAHSQLKIIGEGKNRVDSIHVKDAAHSHVKALIRLIENPNYICGKDYNLSTSRPFLLWEEINRFYLTQNLTPITTRISPKKAILGLKIKSIIKGYSDFASEYFVYQLSNDRWFDCSRAWRDFDFQCTHFQ